MSTSLATIDQRLQESLNDRISVVCTTAIAANTSIVSTNLLPFDGGNNDTFNTWWVYITDYANAGVERQIADYATTTGTITVRGGNLASDGASLATIEVTRTRRTNRVNAINRAIEEVYPVLHKGVDDRSLIVGNWLPNSHFDYWAVSTNPLFYSLTTATAIADTTSGEYWSAGSSAKVTASSGNGYLEINSSAWPKLLDLADSTVRFYCRAKPQTANDAVIEIYTRKADGTEQTITSSASNPASRWTQLSLEDKKINAGIEYISIRFKVTTSGQYVIFDEARLESSRGVNDYWLPQSLQRGTLQQTFLQTGGFSAYIVDDVQTPYWRPEQSWTVTDDGSYRYLRLPDQTHTTARRIRLVGTSPLVTTALSAATDTIPLDASGQLDMLVAYAKYRLYQIEGQPVSTQSRQSIQETKAEAYGEYQMLKNLHRMGSPSAVIKV